MPDSCCAVHCTNMQEKCDENIKFYRFSTMKNQQITERYKKWVTEMKRQREREKWSKTEKQVENARLCSEHFVACAKSDDSFHIDHVPTVFVVVSVTGVSRKRKSIDRYKISQKRARNQDGKK